MDKNEVIVLLEKPDEANLKGIRFDDIAFGVKPIDENKDENTAFDAAIKDIEVHLTKGGA